jgi:hypothetical protein
MPIIPVGFVHYLVMETWKVRRHSQRGRTWAAHSPVAAASAAADPAYQSRLLGNGLRVSFGVQGCYLALHAVHPFSDPRSILRMSIVEDTTLLVEITGSNSSLRQFVVAGQPLLGCCPKDGRRGVRNPFPGQTLPKSPQAMTASPKLRGFVGELLGSGRGRDSTPRIGSNSGRSNQKTPTNQHE